MLAGYCLHDEAGVQLASFEAAFMGHCQTLFPPKLVPRKLLKHGFMVVKMMSDGVEPQEISYFHIGRATFTAGDWRFTMLRMIPNSSAADLVLEADRAETWTYTWQAFTDFTKECRYLCQFFILRARRKPLSPFKISVITVTPHSEASVFWGGHARLALPRLPRPPRGPNEGRIRGPRNHGIQALPAPEVAPRVRDPEHEERLDVLDLLALQRHAGDEEDPDEREELSLRTHFGE